MSKPKKSNHLPPDLKIIFGAVVSQPGRYDGRPFLLESGVEVKEILAAFKEGLSDRDISRRFRRQGLTFPEIEAVRAYQARFLPETLSAEFNRVSSQNVFMVDQNVSYRALYDIVKMFGRSSHVQADGLYGDHNDDERDIWQHAIDHKYQAILTADMDFLRISQYHRNRMIDKYGSLENCPEHIPAVVYFENTYSMRDSVELLHAFQDDIRQFLKDNDAVYLSISWMGAKKVYSHTHGKGIDPEDGPTPWRENGHAPG
jgi:uncharacterized protein (DUF433 family)